MTWIEALESPAVARTGNVARYRRLCSDDNPDARSRDGHRALILRLAGATPDGTAGDAVAPAAAESVALAARMKACPYRSRDAGCGCSGGRCALRRGAIVSHLDCFPCLERYG